MKTFNQLIRLHRHRLHERQKELTRLEAEVGEIKLKIEMLEAEALIEEARAEETQIGSVAFAPYFKRVKEHRIGLIDSKQATERKVVSAREALKHAFQELKRIEILRDQKLAEAAETAKKAEQAALDEVAIGQHRRGDRG